MKKYSFFYLVVLPCGGLAACVGVPSELDSVSWQAQALEAHCEVPLFRGDLLDVETDYLPHVVACENGGAGPEALKAQAVAARSYLYYRLEDSGTIEDGPQDQVYTCSRLPREEHYEAVRQTSGLVVTFQQVVICAFYVAGARPSTGDCVPVAGDADWYRTERYVTYNEGAVGDEVEQTSLGWVNRRNIYNRGCMSQNGGACLADLGLQFEDILHFYYGADVVVEQAAGPCVDPQFGPES